MVKLLGTLTLLLFWGLASASPTADSLQIETAAPSDSIITTLPEDSLHIEAESPMPVIQDSLATPAADTSRWANDPILKLFRSYLEPAAYVVAVGGILYVLFSARGR